MKKVYLKTIQEAEQIMGGLYHDNIIGGWNSKKTAKGYDIRYLNLKTKLWNNLVERDMEVFGVNL